MKSVVTIHRSIEIAEAVKRYFKFVLDVNGVVIDSMDDPYGNRDRVQRVLQSDFLIIDGFIGQKAKGFQFAKAMEKQTLILFYPGEIDIQVEGPFWLVLPYSLNRLGGKIKEIIEQSPPDEEEYVKLEKQFPILKDQKTHQLLSEFAENDEE